MHPLDKLSDKDEVKKYFTGLGYYVGWDFKRATGEQWYDIYVGNYLICQIDMGIPLSAIIEDFLCLRQGKTGTSKFDYKVSGPNSKELTELMEKVYQTQNKK